jgi:membrane protein
VDTCGQEISGVTMSENNRSPNRKRKLGLHELSLLWRKSFRDVLLDKGFTHAAAIAYYAIVSVFPLLLLLIGIVGFFLKETSAEKIVGLAWPYLPAGSLQLLRENITAIVQSRNSIPVLSFIGLLWSASLMFDAINEAVNSAWSVRSSERYWISKLKSFLMMILLLVVVMSSLAMTAQAALFARFGSLLFRVSAGSRFWSLGHDVWPTLVRMLAFVIAVGVFTMLYLYLPRLRVELRDVLPGAVQAGILWELTKQLFVWYISSADFRKVYGSISAVLLLLIWTHVSALILIWGGEFSAEYARFRRFPARTRDGRQGWLKGARSRRRSLRPSIGGLLFQSASSEGQSTQRYDEPSWP